MSETFAPPTQDDIDRFMAELGPVRPSIGEGLSAAVSTGFEGSLPGALGTIGREVQGARRDPTPLGKEEFGASGLQRRGMVWDEGMTRGRAEAMARTFDENQQRNRVMTARDPGLLEAALQFGAQLGGNLFDPANLLPFAGAASFAARGARNLAAGAAMLTESTALAGASRLAGSAAGLLEARGVAAGIARGVADATLGNLATAPLIYGVAERYGEDVTFGTVMRDLSIGAIIGAGFGAAAGALGRGSDPRTAIRVLDAVAADLAAGRVGEVPMPLVRASVEDAVMRSAPVEMQGVRLADLPTAPDGAPLTRAEFDAWATQAGRMPPEPAPTATADAPVVRGVEVAEQAPVAPQGATVRPTDTDALPAALSGPGRQPAQPDATPMAVSRQEPAAAQVRVEDATGATVDHHSPQAIAAVHDAARAEGYTWYREAIDARHHVARMAAAPNGEMVPIQGRETAIQETPARAGPDAPDPEMVQATRQIDAMRAEGRFTAADEAILRAGADTADELDATAKGLEEAGACLLRNLA